MAKTWPWWQTHSPDPEQHCKPSRPERKLFLTYKAAANQSQPWEEETFVRNLNSKCKLMLLLIAALLLTTGAWAADKAAPSEGVMELQGPSSVSGTQLPAGKYRVRWTSTSGEMVDLKIYRGSKQVAST